MEENTKVTAAVNENTVNDSKKKLTIVLAALIAVIVIAVIIIIALVTNGGTSGGESKKDNTLFNEGMLAVCSDGQWGYINKRVHLL